MVVTKVLQLHLLFSSVPVKPLDSCEVFYSINLSWIVKECRAPFVLSNTHLFKDQNEATTEYMQNIINSTEVEWLCESLEDPVQQKSPEATTGSAAPEVMQFPQASPEAIEEVEEGLDQASPRDVAFMQFATTGK